MTNSDPPARFSPSPPPSMGGGVSFWNTGGHPDWFLELARQLVVDNHNEHYEGQDDVPVLHLDNVFVDWFSTVLKRWKVLLRTHAIKGRAWMVSYDEFKDEAYIEIFQKIGNEVVRKAKNP